MKKKALTFAKLFRIADWWNYLIPPILCFVYIGCLNNTLPFRESILPCIVMLVSSIITASFGFYINDLFDIKDDALAGKHNQIGQLNRAYRIPLLIILTLLSIAPWLLTDIDLHIKALLIAQYVFFIGYSAPPFRLKKNKIFALLLDSLYSGTLFYIIALLVTNNNKYVHPYLVYVLLFCWGFSKGLRNILLHVILDKKNDEKADTKTLATHLPLYKILNFISYIIIPLEVTFFILLMWFLLLNSKASLFIIIGYGCFLLYLLVKPLFLKDKHGLITFYRLNDFYEIVLPGLILLMLAYTIDYRYLIILAIHYILFPRVLLKLKKAL